ncbi:MAG: tetratricopeptide repeat protein [Gemmatimonadota bacterium]|nr:tetratricopeptide repeat protein [Gemmatimonadota bacterium]
MSFLSTMSAKDIIALAFSFTAFVVSMISLRQKKFETERAIRRELSDAIDKINKINIETAKLWEDGITPAEQNMLNVYGQQGVSLTRQALYLAEQIPKRVSDVEYGTIAQALINLGNLSQADAYYRKSVEQSPDEFAKALNKRVYAHFLFMTGQVERGRQLFQECLAPFDAQGDYNLYAKGTTYLRWAMAETIFTSRQAGEEKFTAARDAIQHISNSMLQMNARREYDNTLSELTRQMTPPRPGALGVSAFSPPASSPPNVAQAEHR